MNQATRITQKIILGLLIFITACSPVQNKVSSNNNLEFTMDSLQKVYAPDKRVKLWKIAINSENGKLIMHLMLDNENAYNAVNNVLKSRFPEVEAQIELLPAGSKEQTVNALANNSVINLRSNSRHSAEIATQVRLGTPLKVLKKQGSWYLVQSPNKYLAWTDEAAIVKINKQELEEYKNAQKIVFNKQYGFSYSKPDKNSQVVTDLILGCILPVQGSKGKYYEVKYPDGRKAWVLKKEFIHFEDLAAKDIDVKEVVETAKKFNGIPYLWGGTSSKAIDCSGFTSTVYFMNGTVLQRDASQQTKYGKEITTKYEYSKLKPGDLLFYGRPVSDSLPERVTHVALYINNGEFIHASGKVRINSIDSTHNNFISSYPPRFVRAVRINGYFDDYGIQRINENDFYKEILN